LEKKGFIVQDLPLFGTEREHEFIKNNKINFFNTSFAYFKRLYKLLFELQYDCIWLDSEIFPGIPFGWESLLIHPDDPVVLDISDAHFYKYSKGKNFLQKWFLDQKIPIWLQRAEKVIVSTPEVRDYCQNFNPESILLPSAIDISKYSNAKMMFTPNDMKSEFVLGWTGSIFTTRFLYMLRETFLELKRVFPIKLLLLGADPEWDSPVKTEIVPYSPENEIKFLQQIDIGIQPLPYSLKETGNPSIRLLKYMANYKPIVSTPIGAANLFLRHSENGFFARTLDDWYLSIRLLIEDESLRAEMGAQSRKIVESEFLLERSAKRLVSTFSSL
jgi:glycosyltransferase involved in cell wall biosynthesis